MLYHIAICDDERTDAEYIRSQVTEWAEAAGNAVSIDTFPSAEAFLFHYEENKRYDILLLDIEMGTMNGVELAKKIREDNDAIQLLFITGFPDFIAEGYEVSALHYLMKPVNRERLEGVLDKAVRNLKKTERSLLVTIGGETVRISISEIFFVEAFAHTTRLTTKERQYELQKSISEVERQLEGDFVRCHRSYLAGLAHIRRITKTAVILDNGQELPLSRGQYQNVNQAFIAYYMEG